MNPDDPYYLPPDRRPTAPKTARVEVEPPPETRRDLEAAKAHARTAEDEIVTMVRCPLCRALGLVTPEIAATFDALCAKAREQS